MAKLGQKQSSLFNGSKLELREFIYIGDVPHHQWLPYFKCAKLNKKYLVLVEKSTGFLIMSDTPIEVRSCSEAIDKCFGEVLIVGLGINLINDKVLDSDKVKSVTTMENDKDVIDNIYTKTDVLYWDAEKFNKNLIGVFDSIYWDALGDFKYNYFKKYLKPNGRLLTWDINYTSNLINKD